jgi:hypothetical protein
VAVGDKEWRVILKQTYIERSGTTPPRVGDPIMLTDSAGMPHVRLRTPPWWRFAVRRVSLPQALQ